MAQVGLREVEQDAIGRMEATELVREYLEKVIAFRHDRLKRTPSMDVTEGDVRFIGRCTFGDSNRGVAYHVVPRNGWYRFHPPVERHLDQLHVYMRGLDASRGQLVYVSMADVADVRTWPPQKKEDSFVTFDEARYGRIVERAETIRDVILNREHSDELRDVPFPRCGCYLCETEQSTDDQSTMERSINPGPTGDTARKPIDELDTTIVGSDGQHIPAPLRKRDIWVVWDCRQKLPRAPWHEGSMYPCKWAAHRDVNPRTSFEKAKMVAELPVEEVHGTWPFPDEDDLPERLKPAILLEHEPSDPIVLVDIDDVRDPSTGETLTEAVDLVERLGGYAEISQSGTGFHTFLQGRLPEGEQSHTMPLDGRGHVEVYDCSRFVANSWNHMEGTPHDEVPTSFATDDGLPAALHVN